MAINHADGTQTHVGLVISPQMGWYNNSMDVQSYNALVWNPAENKPQSIFVYDDFDSRKQSTLTVDATPEVMAAYEAWRERLAQGERERVALLDAQRIEKGKFVEVVRGRKVAKGTRGLIFWTGNKGFGLSVGLKDAAGNVHWTAADNCAVAGHFGTVAPSDAELAEHNAMAAASLAKWKEENPRPAYAPNKGYATSRGRRYVGRRYAY